jgi:hypothetical protein
MTIDLRKGYEYPFSTTSQDNINKIELFAQSSKVVLYRNERQIEFNGIAVVLTDLQFALYYWFCLQILKGEASLPIYDGQSSSEFIYDFLNLYEYFIPKFGKKFENLEELLLQLDPYKKQKETLQDKLNRYKRQKKWLADNKGKIRRKIKGCLGKCAEPFLLKTIKEDNITYYQLDILAEQIQIKRNRVIV